jgi:branched-chain amino acid transport system permease protein
MIFIGLHTILVVGLILLMGYAGQVSLGHSAFYGLGAYISALTTLKFGLSPWIGIAAAMTLSGLLSFMIAWPIFRFRGHFLAFATLGFGIIVYTVFNESVTITGGPSGMSGIPYLSIGDWIFDRDLEYYYLVWGAVFIVILSSLNLVRSRMGRALRAIHSSEIAAQSIGVNISRLKAIVFAISAVYAGLAGSLYAHYLTFVNPSPFGFHLSIMLLVTAVVGGLGTVWGAPVGAAIITLLTEVLRSVIPKFTNHASGEYEIIAFGILLMLVMIFLPQGVVPSCSEILQRRIVSWRDNKIFPISEISSIPKHAGIGWKDKP